MKYKIIILLLLTSCTNYVYDSKNNLSYSAKGFAFIETNSLSNVNANKLSLSHNKLKLGTKMRITNPENKIFIESIIVKKIKYDDFYKVLVSQSIAKKLDLDFDFPYVEINEIKRNKSFVARKAVTQAEEKTIANKAPVTKISIANLSKKEKLKKNILKSYSILVAEFYNLESAELLKKRLAKALNNSNYQLININKKNNKSYELLMGPYNTINKLKNDYIALQSLNFEDLDIKINDLLP
jgi:rare lipoprotein A (peptidoglycan hydrolase)